MLWVRVPVLQHLQFLLVSGTRSLQFPLLQCVKGSVGSDQVTDVASQQLSVVQLLKPPVLLQQSVSDHCPAVERIIREVVSVFHTDVIIVIVIISSSSSVISEMNYFIMERILLWSVWSLCDQYLSTASFFFCIMFW